MWLTRHSRKIYPIAKYSIFKKQKKGRTLNNIQLTKGGGGGGRQVKTICLPTPTPPQTKKQ